ncbi:probable prolyl 4-hydroxylase 6 isoform X2 [Selaginella moellendorffii]|uniref:probable prolyl 4-hydroxylase 6 isoform X2 n=1 Tax=Selaginella moellendorffii TaxID=88036 RepID=UPI000D1C52DB|nr:probable prolyl 4-hydroxylase 6 isoform X2 [Selaginella moellendorffii]|eukprot:XP_024538179.1 probable prolyl 4-hydroxylase 6 isoform X2 [Selaginella moellendorffii]
MEEAFRLALLLLLASLALGAVDDLPGWMGETHSVDGNIRSVTDKSDQSIVDPTKVIQLSWKPRAFLYKGFMSAAECDHVVKMAKDKLQKSMVADNESGKSVLSNIRTSSGMFLSKGQDEVINRIEERIAAWTFLPKENGEAIQVLRYEFGEKYEPHYDYFHDKYNQALGGHRIATVLMYLSDVVKGGETVFPSSEEDTTVKDDSWSDCAKKGIAVKPRKGDALLFYSLHPDATPDESSLHGGCPVIEGEKWSATKWIHVLPFGKPKKEGCADENEKCGEWAAYGECDKNPSYMVGTQEWPGACRKSCKVC